MLKGGSMKRSIVIALLLVFVLTGITYADFVRVTKNASPATVSLSPTSRSRELTFPYETRDIIIFNNDASNGVWINFRGGDTDGMNINNSRFYLDSGQNIKLSDYLTTTITLVCDSQFSSCRASPVSVIGIY